MCKHVLKSLYTERERKTCTEDPKALLIMCSQFKDFKDNSGKPVNQNGTTIKYKILTKHSNNLASLQKQNKQITTSGTIGSKKELTAQPTTRMQTNLVGNFPKLVSTLNQASFSRIEVFKFQRRGPCHISHEQVRCRC